MKILQDSLPRPRLSVAMIVRDEEDVLASSIESVRPIADEVLVLDTGSKDQTFAVASRSGAAVQHLAWADDFAATRNHCLQLVTGDWVLWLDAGERLAPDSAAGLRQFLDEKADPAKAYSLWIQSPPRELDGSAGQVLQIRLMPAGKGLRFHGRVRETLQPSIEAAGMTVEAAPGQILRHARQHDPDRTLAKARRDLSLAFREAKELGDSPPRLLLAAAEAHSLMGELKKARTAFREAVRTAPRGSSEMLAAYYGLLTSLEGDADVQEVRLATCLEALEVFPFDIQLLLAMGNYMMSRERLDLAVRSFEAAVRFGKVTPEVWHLCDVQQLAAICLGLAMESQQRDDEACQVLETALAAELTCQGRLQTRVQQRLLDLYAKLGRTEQALALADNMPWETDQCESIRDAIRGACRVAEQDWTGALGYLQSAYVAGCRWTFCLRWLAVVLLSKGEIEAARPVLQEWQRVAPEDPELRAYLSAAEQSEQKAASLEAVADSRAEQPAGRLLRIDQGKIGPEATPPPSSPLIRADRTDAAASHEP